MSSLLRKLTVKPWEHVSEEEREPSSEASPRAARVTGMVVLLAILSSFFALFMISYYTRSLFPDWEILSEPGLLWANTLVLILASVAMHCASLMARKNDLRALSRYFLLGAALTVIFVVGQIAAWDQLVAEGYYAQANPSFAFYYLLTGLHALHLLGGLWFLGVVGWGMRREAGQERARVVTGTMATYWHYLLLVWLVMFVLLLRT